MKNTQSKIKAIQVGKQSGTTYCFGWFLRLYEEFYTKKSKNDK